MAAAPQIFLSPAPFAPLCCTPVPPLHCLPFPCRSSTCRAWPSRKGPLGRPHYCLRRPAPPVARTPTAAGQASQFRSRPSRFRLGPSCRARHWASRPCPVTARTHCHGPVPFPLAQPLKPCTGHRWNGPERWDTRTCVLRRGCRQQTLRSSMPPLVGPSMTVWARSHLASDALPTHSTGLGRTPWACFRHRLGSRPTGPP